MSGRRFNYILIQPINKKWRPAKRIIQNELGSSLSEYQYEDTFDDFWEWMAKEYKKAIVKAIDNQRYDYNWPPLSIGYYRYKKRKELSLKIWEATGYLKDHIEVRKKRGYLMVGFRYFSIYPDSNVSPILVSRVLEYGNDKCPARPLWRPLYRYMGKHVRRYWEDFYENYDIDME